jgi:hypothetical protein
MAVIAENSRCFERRYEISASRQIGAWLADLGQRRGYSKLRKGDVGRGGGSLRPSACRTMPAAASPDRTQALPMPPKEHLSAAIPAVTTATGICIDARVQIRAANCDS